MMKLNKCEFFEIVRSSSLSSGGVAAAVYM